MIQVKSSQLRSQLSVYMEKVHQGEELLVTTHGKAVARIVPAGDTRKSAAEQLAQLRSRCVIGDVTSPIDEIWEAHGAHS